MDINSLLMGVGSSVVAAIILIPSRYLWGIVLSLIFGCTSSRSINGNWQTVFKDKAGNSHKEFATVHQFFNWVWGMIEYSEKGAKYKFRGKLKGGILVATYRSKGVSTS